MVQIKDIAITNLFPKIFSVAHIIDICFSSFSLSQIRTYLIRHDGDMNILEKLAKMIAERQMVTALVYETRISIASLPRLRLHHPFQFFERDPEAFAAIFVSLPNLWDEGGTRAPCPENIS